MEIEFNRALFIVFFILKLTGVIAWSWWWITSPLWVVPLIYLILFIWFFCEEILKQLRS